MDIVSDLVLNEGDAILMDTDSGQVNTTLLAPTGLSMSCVLTANVTAKWMQWSYCTGWRVCIHHQGCNQQSAIKSQCVVGEDMDSCAIMEKWFTKALNNPQWYYRDHIVSLDKCIVLLNLHCDIFKQSRQGTCVESINSKRSAVLQKQQNQAPSRLTGLSIQTTTNILWSTTETSDSFPCKATHEPQRLTLLIHCQQAH